MFAQPVLACQEESVTPSSWRGSTFPWRSVLPYTSDDLSRCIVISLEMSLAARKIGSD